MVNYMHPWFGDPLFNEKISSKKEIISNSTDVVTDVVNKRCLENYQYLVSNFINPKSPYNSLLLYFSVGVGKTTSAITIAENFVKTGKKVLVITKNEKLISSFKNDLVNVCSRYTTLQEKEVLANGSVESGEKTLKEVLRRISRAYTFITYAGISKSDFNDKIVIVDEVHNLLGNTGYEKLIKKTRESKKYKLVLLSATPVYDNITDIFQLSNILNGNFNQYDLDHLSKYVKKINTNEIGNLYQNKIYELTQQGEKSILENLKGKVSYLKQNRVDFPSMDYPGSVAKIGDYLLPINVVKCVMEGHQESVYNKVINNVKFNPLGGDLEMMSSIIYPDLNDKHLYGKDGMTYYIKNKNYTDFLLLENVKQYSIKLYNLIKNLKKAKGKVFISTKNITDDGVPLIKECLRKNGFTKVLVITSETESDNITRSIMKFNDKSNDKGDIIQILLGSSVISEGITLKSVRQVHIYEPGWNYSYIDQVIGRAVRRGSHTSLPPSERQVDVFLYCAVSTNLNMSVDFAKYVLSSIKDAQIKNIERKIAESSFSCSAFKNRNEIRGVDGSRDCDYTRCEYVCDSKPNNVRDNTTYNIEYHDKETFKRVAVKITQAFTKSKNISKQDLAKLIGEDEDLILESIRYIKGVVKRGDILSYESKAILKPVVTFKKVIKYIPKKIQSANDFSIEFNTTGVKPTKQKCTSYSVNELKDMISVLELVLPAKVTKKSLCDLLETKL